MPPSQTRFVPVFKIFKHSLSFTSIKFEPVATNYLH